MGRIALTSHAHAAADGLMSGGKRLAYPMYMRSYDDRRVLLRAGGSSWIIPLGCRPGAKRALPLCFLVRFAASGLMLPQRPPGSRGHGM